MTASKVAGLLGLATTVEEDCDPCRLWQSRLSCTRVTSFRTFLNSFLPIMYGKVPVARRYKKDSQRSANWRG